MGYLLKQRINDAIPSDLYPSGPSARRDVQRLRSCRGAGVLFNMGERNRLPNPDFEAGSIQGDEMRSDHKQFCASISPDGWQYTGFDRDKGFYCFQTGNYSTGFREILAIDCDLTEQNLALMASLGVTRI